MQKSSLASKYPHIVFNINQFIAIFTCDSILCDVDIDYRSHYCNHNHLQFHRYKNKSQHLNILWKNWTIRRCFQHSLSWNKLCFNTRDYDVTVNLKNSHISQNKLWIRCLYLLIWMENFGFFSGRLAGLRQPPAFEFVYLRF